MLQIETLCTRRWTRIFQPKDNNRADICNICSIILTVQCSGFVNYNHKKTIWNSRKLSMTLNYHKRDQLNAILTVPIRVHWGVSFPFGFQIKWLLISFLLNQKVLFVFFSGHLKYTSGLTSPGWGEGTGKFRVSPDQLFYIGEVAFFSPH